LLKSNENGLLSEYQAFRWNGLNILLLGIADDLVVAHGLAGCISIGQIS
jgi:hypothetical protein